jgi:hypothetical protein
MFLIIQRFELNLSLTALDPPGDPLTEMHRVENVESFYEDPPWFQATPWLLNPSSMKIAYVSTVRQFWHGLENDGLANLGLSIIGFSLPKHDEYARQAIYTVVKNYQGRYFDEGFMGRKKAPLRLVDLRTTSAAIEELKGRYSFIDWGRATGHFSGFNENVIDSLFD